MPIFGWLAEDGNGPANVCPEKRERRRLKLAEESPSDFQGAARSPRKRSAYEEMHI